MVVLAGSRQWCTLSRGLLMVRPFSSPNALHFWHRWLGRWFCRTTSALRGSPLTRQTPSTSLWQLYLLFCSCWSVYILIYSQIQIFPYPKIDFAHIRAFPYLLKTGALACKRMRIYAPWRTFSTNIYQVSLIIKKKQKTLGLFFVFLCNYSNTWNRWNICVKEWGNNVRSCPHLENQFLYANED